VNCAILSEADGSGTAIPMKVEETTLADFDRVFAVNVRGAFVPTQAALKHIKGGGRIIMIGSCIGDASYMDPIIQPNRSVSSSERSSNTRI
jgi:NAD(P)-dependent dehydrogenase (short-subunit alcohol dehydrogenase family)